MARRSRRRSYDSSFKLSDQDMAYARGASSGSEAFVRASRDARRSGSTAALAKTVGEVGAGVALNAWLSSRYENVFHPGGTRIPLDAVGAAVALYAAHKGFAGKLSPDLARLALGMGLGWVFKMGAGFGTTQRAAQNLPPIAITAGMGKCHCHDTPANASAAPQLAPGAAAGPARPMTEAEMAAYSRSY